MWSWDYSEELQVAVRVANVVLVLMKIALMHQDEEWNPPETSLFQSCLGVQNSNPPTMTFVYYYQEITSLSATKYLRYNVDFFF